MFAAIVESIANFGTFFYSEFQTLDFRDTSRWALILFLAIEESIGKFLTSINSSRMRSSLEDVFPLFGAFILNLMYVFKFLWVARG